MRVLSNHEDAGRDRRVRFVDGHDQIDGPVQPGFSETAQVFADRAAGDIATAGNLAVGSSTVKFEPESFANFSHG